MNKLDMTREQIEELQAVYGENDPDIVEALRLVEESEKVPPTETGEEVEPVVDVPPTETGEEVESVVNVPPTTEGEEVEPPKKEAPMIPLAALQDERRKRQELEAKLKLMESSPAPIASQQPPTQGKPEAGSIEEFLSASPGKLAKQIFAQESTEPYDPYSEAHQERLQELTSIITVKQLQTGELHRQVQAERQNFSNEVLKWRDEMLTKPEVEAKSMERYNTMPDGSHKKMLTLAWDRLMAGQASADEFELIRLFNAETEAEMSAPEVPAVPKKSGAGMEAALGLPQTADVKGGGGAKNDNVLELIEKKLDRGERLTPEEEKIIKSLK